MIISIQMENEEHTDTEKLVGELKREQEDILMAQNLSRTCLDH